MLRSQVVAPICEHPRLRKNCILSLWWQKCYGNSLRSPRLSRSWRTDQVVGAWDRCLALSREPRRHDRCHGQPVQYDTSSTRRDRAGTCPLPSTGDRLLNERNKISWYSCDQSKLKWTESRSSQKCLTATGSHTPYGITKCYLLIKAGTQFSNPGKMQKLS